MAEVRIAAEQRTEFGKGAARRVRRANKVPAVLYGHGADVRHISLPGHELMLALKVQNALLTIELDGASELAVNIVDLHATLDTGLVIIHLPVRCDQVQSDVVDPAGVGATQ